jgi:putative membrane protein
MTTLPPRLFFGVYLALFSVCAIQPFDRAVWWAENLPIMALVAIIAWVQRHHRFSAMSYLMMSFLVCLHTIGGHFTFALVPFDFVTDLFDFERNHYDRMAHFTVGFFAYPLAEILQRHKLVNSRWLLYLFPIFSIVTLAAFYELFEWAYALYADPEAGIAVLGAQGDVWDAQQDMLADTLGALVAMIGFTFKGMKVAEGKPSSQS